MNVSGKNFEPANVEQLKGTLQKSLFLIKQCNHMNFSAQRGLVAIGNTGSGKSTLVNLLLGGTLKVVQENKNNFMLSYAGKGIKGGGRSCTDIPQRFFLNDVVIWDTPGLKDTRDHSFSIMSAYYTREIIKKTAQISFLLVVQAEALTVTRGNSIVKLLNHLMHMVKEPLVMAEHTVLVLTKSVWLKDDSEARAMLRSIVAQAKEYSAKEIAFFKAFADIVNIALFHLPNIHGMAVDAKVDIENNEKLKSVKNDIMAKVKFTADVEATIAKNILIFMDHVNSAIAKINAKNREVLNNLIQAVSVTCCNTEKDRIWKVWILNNLFTSFQKKDKKAIFHTLNSLADALVCVDCFSMAERNAMRKRVADIEMLFTAGKELFKIIANMAEWKMALYNNVNIKNDILNDFGLLLQFDFFMSRTTKRIKNVFATFFAKLFTPLQVLWVSSKKQMLAAKEHDKHYYYVRIRPKFKADIDIDDLNVEAIKKKFPKLLNASDEELLLSIDKVQKIEEIAGEDFVICS